MNVKEYIGIVLPIVTTDHVYKSHMGTTFPYKAHNFTEEGEAIMRSIDRALTRDGFSTRWLFPGSIITMDIRQDRYNVDLAPSEDGSSATITDIRVG
jgi:hypothetical protein